MKQRRLEREAERAAREAEAAAAARAREAAQFSSWARHEDEFHLQQARLRSQIRIRDGRGQHLLFFKIIGTHNSKTIQKDNLQVYTALCM